MNFAILRNVNYKRVLLISRKNTIFFLNKEKKERQYGKIYSISIIQPLHSAI